MWYVLGTVVVVFGGVALLIFLALSSNRGASTQPQPTQQHQGDSDWKKWGEYVGWAFFALIVFDLFRKFVFPNVPIEWKEWIPSFSWNTVEIIIATIGVVVLWDKREKKTTVSGGSGVVVTDIPYAHNPPPVMYNGIPQVKWLSSIAESLWNAVAIPIVILAVLAGVIYASNKMPGLVNFWKWTTTPTHFPAWLMVLFVANAIMAFVHKSNCFPILALGIFCSIVGYNAFPGTGTTVPAIVAVLPATMFSCYALWKSDFADWRIPGAFLILLLFAF